MIISLLLILFLSVWIGLLDMFAEKYRDCETKTDYISSKNSPFIEKQIAQDYDLYPLLNGRYRFERNRYT